MPPSPTHLTDFSNIDIEVQRIGHGSFGVVYMGPNMRDGNFRAGQWFALKTLHPHLLADRRVRTMFVREGLTWVGLWPHANLLTAHSVTLIGDRQPFLILDYAAKGSLGSLLSDTHAGNVSIGGRLLAAGQRLPLSLALRFAQHIAAGLVALHSPDPLMGREEPVVHRDLKPDNVLLDEYGYAMITDFGLAKAVADAVEDRAALTGTGTAGGPQDLLGTAGNFTTASPGAQADVSRSQLLRTRQGMVLGTPLYMAPEQWENPAMARTPVDIYALGLMIYELLIGGFALEPAPAEAVEAATAEARAVGGRPDLARWQAMHQAGRRRPLASRDDGTTFPPALEALYQACLAPRPESRPDAATVLAGLQAAASALGEQPYTPPDTYPRTNEHLRTMLESLSITCGLYSSDDTSLCERGLALCEQALSVPGCPVTVHITEGNCFTDMAHQAQRRGDQAATLDWVRQAIEAFATVEAALPPGDRARLKATNNRANLLSDFGDVLPNGYAEAEALYAELLTIDGTDADRWANRADNQRLWARTEGRAGQMEAARAHAHAGLDCIAHALAIVPAHPGYVRLQTAIRQLLVELEG